MFLGSFANHTICFDANKLWKIPGTSLKERKNSAKEGSQQMGRTIAKRTSKTENIYGVNHHSGREPSEIFAMKNSRTFPSKYSDFSDFKLQQKHKPYDIVDFANLPTKPLKRRCKYCERLCGLRSPRKDSYAPIRQKETGNTQTPTISVPSSSAVDAKRYSTATARTRPRIYRDRDKKSYNVKEDGGYTKLPEFPISRIISPNSCRYCRRKREKTLEGSKYYHINSGTEISNYSCSESCGALTPREYMMFRGRYHEEKINFARDHCYPPSSRHEAINFSRIQNRTPRHMVVTLQPKTRYNSSAIVQSHQRILNYHPSSVQTYGLGVIKRGGINYNDKRGLHRPETIPAVPKTTLGSLSTLAASSVGYNSCWRCFGGSDSDDSDYTTEDEGSDSGGGDSFHEVENEAVMNLSNPSLAPSDIEDSSGGSDSGDSSAGEQISSNSSIYNEEIMLQEAQGNQDGELSSDENFDANAGGYNLFDEQSITDSDEYFDTDENDGIYCRNDPRETEVQTFSKSLSSVDIL